MAEPACGPDGRRARKAMRGLAVVPVPDLTAEATRGHNRT
jgi:hypothetical protein